MPLVVVGGHSRNIGKTSVVAGLIAALPAYRWTAMKITQYGHGICSRNGEPCDCACDQHTWSISEEKSRAGDSDTSRFLVAGAERVWWVRTEQGRLKLAISAIQQKLAESRYAILESNSILEFLQPELYVTVLDRAKGDFKNSAKQYFDRADAVLVNGNCAEAGKSRWSGISLDCAAVPVFKFEPPAYVTPEIAAFVRAKLGAP
jgi:hypothetical protein